jgi:hypothetical protein
LFLVPQSNGHESLVSDDRRLPGKFKPRMDQQETKPAEKQKKMGGEKKQQNEIKLHKPTIPASSSTSTCFRLRLTAFVVLALATADSSVLSCALPFADIVRAIALLDEMFRSR